MDDLEQQLVAVDPLVGALLQREQLLGVEVPLVVARRVAREDGGVEVLVRRRHRGEHTGRVSDLFSDAAATARGRDRAASASRPAAHARRARRPAARARARDGAAARDRGGPRAVDDPARPARCRQDDDRPDRRRGDRRRSSRSCPPSRRGSTTSAPCSPGRATGSAGTASARSCSSTRSTASTSASRTRCCHAVEDGLVTLIGATTENPYFEVNQALLSRCTVIELEPLTVEELAARRRSAAPPSSARTSPTDVAAEIARRAGGDARTALQTLELAWETAQRGGRAARRSSHVDDAARKRPLRYDRAGDRHYDLASAFIKSMRGSDPDAAVYYLAAMLEGGEDPRFLARRIVIAASEDVGNADPRALARRRRGRAGGRARRAARGAAEPRAGRDLRRAGAEVERLRAGDLERAGATSGGTGSQPPPAMLRSTGYRGAAARGHGVRVRLAARRSAPRRRRPPPRERARADVLCSVRQRRGGGGGGEWRSRRVTRPRSSTSRRRPACRASGSRTTSAARTSCSSSIPFAFTAVCTEEALDLQENLASFRNANTEIVFVSCDASAARQAWKQELGAEYTFASDFWSHGAAAKRYGVFNEANGAPRPRHVPDRQRRRRHLVARARRRHAPHRDGAGVARRRSREGA